MTTTTSTDVILTVAEVAAILKVSERAVQDLLLRKVLVGFRVGKLWRVKQSELDAYIERAAGGTP
jgi:excisionase family DNA binding protein